MKLSETLRFSLAIITRKPGRAIIVFCSIMIGTAAMLLFLSFANGLEQAVLTPILGRSSPTTLIISPNYRSLDFLTGGTKITNQVVEEIHQTTGVQKVDRQLSLGFPNSLRMSLFGIEITSDVPVFGVDENITNGDENYIPVAISPYLIDLFNSSFAESLPGASRLSPETVLHRHLTLIFGKSSFFSVEVGNNETREKAAEVTTLSTRVPPVGISIPMSIALEINQSFGKTAPSEAVFQQLFVETKTVDDISGVKTAIETMGFSARSFEELGEEVRLLANTIRVILFFAAAIILIIAFFALFALISIIIIEYQKNIGILRALGASRQTIVQIFLFFAVILTFAGILGGMFLSYGSSLIIERVLKNTLPDLLFLAGDFFPFSYRLVGEVGFGVLVAALLFAYFPVRSATKREILALLWR